MKKTIHYSCAALGLLACACFAQNEKPALRPGESSKSEWTVRGHVSPEKFVIQSHRGAGELAPENTIEAFELGWKLGTIPESDIRTTRDGVIVTFHDNNFA